MKNIISGLLIFATGLIIFSGCAQHSKPETIQQPEVVSPPGEKIQSKVLADYIRLVRDKVMSNWRKAHGRYDNLAIASFIIHPDGKIDKPQIVQSTGIPNLDGLALKAIKNSAPFPPIPPKINKPNLPIKINFQYLNRTR